jgi:hypothetical protein
LADLGADPAWFKILGSWGDALQNEQILEMFRVLIPLQPNFNVNPVNARFPTRMAAYYSVPWSVADDDP